MREFKKGRSLIKQNLKQQERFDTLISLPVSLSRLQELFDWLDLKLSSNDCDDSLKFSLEFIEKNGLPQMEVFKWFEDNGGYCDCEVLANIEEKINE